MMMFKILGSSVERRRSCHTMFFTVVALVDPSGVCIRERGMVLTTGQHCLCKRIVRVADGEE